MIRGEADELEEEDIAPLRASLRELPTASILKATVEGLCDDSGTAASRWIDCDCNTNIVRVNRA